MIPDHLIPKALNAWIGDHNCPHPDQIGMYRVLITRSLEAVAAEFWEDGYEEGAGDEFAINRADERGTDWPPLAPNPYRASEGK